MGTFQRMLEETGPRAEEFEEKAVSQLQKAHRLRKTGIRAAKEGIRAVKQRKPPSLVDHCKARIQQCIEEIQALSLPPRYLRSEFADQTAAELMELVCFECAYPAVFLGGSFGSKDFLSAERLGISPQARYHGIADVPGELAKAVTGFRRGRLPLKEKVVLRERLLGVLQDIISYLADATDESVLEITGHEKDFRRRFEGKVASIGTLINRLNEELVELQGQIHFVEEVRRAARGASGDTL